MPTLFHDIERIDRTPQGHIEDSFAFLDRVDSPYWERVRTQLDEWYADFPDTDNDLRKRFRSRNPRQHYPAWWELYVYTLLRKLGYTVTVHPEIPDSAGRPDFLAERGDESFYVEAAAVFSGIVAPGRRGQIEAKIKDTLDNIPAHEVMVRLEFTPRPPASPRCASAPAHEVMVRLEFTQIGNTTPRRHAITQPVEEWLRTIDADDLLTGVRLTVDVSGDAIKLDQRFGELVSKRRLQPSYGQRHPIRLPLTQQLVRAAVTLHGACLGDPAAQLR